MDGFGHARCALLDLAPGLTSTNVAVPDRLGIYRRLMIEPDVRHAGNAEGFETVYVGADGLEFGEGAEGDCIYPLQY